MASARAELSLYMCSVCRRDQSVQIRNSLVIKVRAHTLAVNCKSATHRVDLFIIIIAVTLQPAQLAV